MKIAIIRQRYNPFGGAERVVERALAGLLADGLVVRRPRNRYALPG